MKRYFTLCRLIILSLLILAPTISCRYSERNKTFTYDNDWSMEYVSYLRKSSYVYPGSELQLANGYRDTYVFVREVVTSLSQPALADSLLSKLAGSLEDPRVESDSIYTIDGAVFVTRELTGLLQDKRMYYLLSVIESEGRLFQFTGWMFNHKRDLWANEYKVMLHSWRNN